MSLNTKPLKEVAYAALGLPVIWVARSTLGEWPQTGVTMAFDGEAGIISFAPTSFSVDGLDALWSLTAEQIATLDGITSWRIQINGAWPLMAGFLSWGSGWAGVDEPQILGSVVVGPIGPAGPIGNLMLTQIESGLYTMTAGTLTQIETGLYSMTGA